MEELIEQYRRQIEALQIELKRKDEVIQNAINLLDEIKFKAEEGTENYTKIMNVIKYNLEP